VECIPQACYKHILGEDGILQMPDPEEHRRAILSFVRTKAGSNGTALAKARRVLGALLAFKGGNWNWPATSMLLDSFLADVGNNNAKKTAVKTAHSGLQILRDIGLPLHLTPLAKAPVPPSKKGPRPRSAASLPIKVYAHLERSKRGDPLSV
jgi:hypothetical protein